MSMRSKLPSRRALQKATHLPGLCPEIFQKTIARAM